MNNLELEGTLMKKMAVQTGTSARGEWAKQEFLVEYADGRFPANVVFSVWGQDKVNELGSFNVGDLVRVSFKPSSREYNGKYYTDLRAWNVVRATGQQSATPAAPAQASSQSVPAGFRSASLPSIEDMPEDSEASDLPF